MNTNNIESKLTRKGRFAYYLLVFVSSCLLFSACHKSGTWDDSTENWERAFGGQAKPSNVTVHHSRYWRSLHFTYEAGYYFELSAPDDFLEAWIQGAKLKSVVPDSTNFHALPDQPTWFAPKPMESYDMWLPSDEPYSSFRIYRDRETKRIFAFDSR